MTTFHLTPSEARNRLMLRATDVMDRSFESDIAVVGSVGGRAQAISESASRPTSLQ